MICRVFWVDGHPTTKGSFRPVRTARGLRLIPQLAGSRPWANAVAWSAKAAGLRPVDEAVTVTLEFFFARPKKSKHGFPYRGDTDKLARNCLDALKGIAYTDDAQVVQLVASKAYAGDKGPGAWVRVASAELATKSRANRVQP